MDYEILHFESSLQCSVRNHPPIEYTVVCRMISRMSIKIGHIEFTFLKFFVSYNHTIS